MARIAYRPITMVDYGDVINTGGGNILGDNDDASFKQYMEDSGSIGVWPNFNEGDIPFGRSVIAVRIAHRQRNTGIFGLYNGWIASYLRINNQRVPQTYAYKQDGYIDGGRQIMGPPLYKSKTGAWTTADLNKMGGDTGSAVGPIGPSQNRWCVASELYILVVTDEDTPVPTVPYPANGETIATSSVGFSAQIPAVQEEQPVRAVFQVARDNTFTTDVRTYVGGENSLETPTARSGYVSVKGQASYTDLGPGTWYLRMKGRDYRGIESGWGVTTSFSIVHTALPVPTLLAPNPGSISPNPYAIRVGNIPTTPSGDRKVGIEWNFSKVSDFGSGVVAWANQKSGRFDAGNIQYNPQPDPSTAPGLNGPLVSLEDPDQRLSQSHWYSRVRAIDVYGQVGAWSSNFEFDVSHIPVVADADPNLDIAFDKDTELVQWRFTDPWSGDLQTAYQLKVYNLTDNLLFDSGKVLSSIPKGEMILPSGHLQEHMYYTLELWDLDDVKSTSLEQFEFFLSTSPIITLPFPAENEAIVTGQPELTWSAEYARVDITQHSYRIVFRQIDNANVVYDTGTVVTASTTHLPPRAILKNLVGYQIALTIVDSDGLESTLLRNFSTNFVRPEGTLAFATSEMYNTLGYVEVAWRATVDPFFAEFRVYRRKVTDPLSEFEYIGKVEDPESMVFHDWTVAGSADFEYSVTQAAYRFGSLVESEFEEFPVSVRIDSDNYWLVHPDDESRNVMLHSVVAEKFTNKKQTSSYVIIDGGMRVNQGPKIGKDGSLSCRVRASAGRTATEQLEMLRSIDEYRGWVVMRDPFGNNTKISLGEISVERIAGVGNQEFADLDIPYVEVR